ncbi:hypothetical protein PFISCL1PPCAC_4449, partial [Pristionchus fissidentatus]
SQMELGEGRNTVLISGPNGQIKLESDEGFEMPNPDPLPTLADFKMEEVLVKEELINDSEEAGEGDTIPKRRNKKNTPFGCEICHKSFAKEYTLKTHMAIHSEERRFGCDKCGSTFKQKGQLNKHKKVKCEDRPHRCQICLKGFEREDQLQDHQTAHEHREKMKGEGHQKVDGFYKCTYCPKKFRFFSVLGRHLAIHTGDRPFGCDKCDMKFQSTNALETHKARHKGKRPLLCTLCRRRFFTMGHLNYHIEKMHPNLPYGCPTCNERFTVEEELITHNLTHSKQITVADEGTVELLKTEQITEDVTRSYT